MSSTENGVDYYARSAQESVQLLASTSDGLSSLEAEARLARDGPNTVTVDKQATFLGLFFKQLRQYLAILLFAVAAIAAYAGYSLHKEEQYINAILIVSITLLNAIISAYQDYKSEKTAQVLAKMLEINALVMRDSKPTLIPASRLVIGDVIKLVEGDKVPADCRIIDANNLIVNESILTGESKSVKKSTAPLTATLTKNENGAATAIADQRNMLFMDTFVVSGEATAIVCAIGKRTQVGTIAAAIKTDERAPFLDEINDATKLITKIALGFIACVVILYILTHHSWDDILLIASALIVGSIPEGLPAVVTFSLSMTTFRLAQDKILIKKKSLLETLGSIDILCTDKTGTLTQNKMTLASLYIDGKDQTLNQASEEIQELFAAASLVCNQSQFMNNNWVGQPEDTCFLAALTPTQLQCAEQNTKRLSFAPFSAQKKLSSAIALFSAKPTMTESATASTGTVSKSASSKNAQNQTKKQTKEQTQNQKIQFIKGAPEVIIQKATHQFIAGKQVKLSKKNKEFLLGVISIFSAKALRNIALAAKIDGKMTIIALAGLHDPPRDGVGQAVQTLYDAGIEVKMITGDEKETALAIALECGFRSVNAITASEMEAVTDAELQEIVKKYNIFARTPPSFKLRLVSALQAMGHRVAITGDGVNDVPALERADVGIAVGEGAADIAKESADIILLDGHFEHITKSIQGGRTVFSNCRKVINYLISANFAEIIMVFVCALLGVVPFTAIQLLWVNFVTDIFPAMALGIDPPHAGIMKKKPTGSGETLINKHLGLLTGFVGITKFLIMFGIYFFTVFYTHSVILAQTLSFTWLVLTHLIRVIAIRFDEHEPLLNNWLLFFALLIPLVLQIFILYIPVVAKWFAVIALPWWSWFILAGALLASILVARIISVIVAKLAPSSDKDY